MTRNARSDNRVPVDRSVNVRFHLSPELKQRARDAALAADVSLSEWLRRVVRDATDRKPRKDDAK